MFFGQENIPITKIPFSDKVQLYILRLDQIHPHISGNKWYKLKYNVQEALNKKNKTILTFGGAFSNHIAAVAAAGKQNHLNIIGVIRGEEHTPLNPTLQFAQEQGMIFHYMDRATYREKDTEEVIENLKAKFGDFYLVPEGGTNDLAIKGTEEILDLIDIEFDVVCCPVGTGGTIAGIINRCPENKKALGFPALKGDFLEKYIQKLVSTQKENYELIHDYHFGGYAKFQPELIDFINNFKQKFKIPLDPIYTGKMMYGLCDLIEKDYFKEGSKIVAIHTGGLQGIKGFNKRFGNLVMSD